MSTIGELGTFLARETNAAAQSTGVIPPPDAAPNGTRPASTTP
jgi:hypothetical protein